MRAITIEELQKIDLQARPPPDFAGTVLKVPIYTEPLELFNPNIPPDPIEHVEDLALIAKPFDDAKNGPHLRWCFTGEIALSPKPWRRI